MKKRVISIVLAVSVAVSAILSLNLSLAFGADNYCGAGTGLTTTGKNATWVYDESTTTLTISGTGATKDYGDTALNRVPWYDYRDAITTVVVEEGITEIGTMNFANFTALTDVSLPKTLTTIAGGTANYGAFKGCTALQSIALPMNLTTIEAMAFRGCTALTSIRIPDSVTSMGIAAFRDCTALETVTYGTGMTSTGVEAFYDCTSLSTINFSSTITSIDSYSFFDTRITSIEIPEQITSIGTRAFANCFFISSATVYNANCEFKGIIGEDPFNGSNQSLTMYGHKGSTTETYANEKGYNFVSIDPCEHTTTHEVITLEATCTETGISTQVCDECGFVVSETQIAAKGHAWVLIESDDETEADGHLYKFYECSNDGCTEEKTVIEHNAFVEGFYEYSNTATCTTAGMETKTCLVEGCGKVERKVASRGNHQVDEYTVTLEPTCLEDGSQEGVCNICGETVTQSIPATGHTNVFVETLDNTAEDGHTYDIYKCSVCNEQTVVPTHVDWIDGNYASTVITEPKCVVNGVRRDVCDICSQSRLVTLPANGEHVWYETTRTEPTCTAVGKIYYACENCTLTKSENIDALGHSYVLQEVSSVAATCTTAGYNTYKCSTCGATNKEVIPATGHTSDEAQEVVVTEADCENDGLANCVCATCGASYEKTISALGHNMETLIVEIEDKPGHTLVTPTCSRCRQTEPASVEHNQWFDGYYTTEVTVKGTCTVPEVTRDTCTLCGKTRTNTGTTTGHSYSYTKTENNGTLVYTCSYCSGEVTRTPQSVAALFPQYINKKPGDTSLGYLFELHPDGIINAKDFAKINAAVEISNAYKS